MIKCLEVDEARALELLRAERDILPFHGERLAEIERLQFGVRLVLSLDLRGGHVQHIVADVLRAVERQHRVAFAERILHLGIRLEMVAVRAVALLEVLAEDGACRTVQHVTEGAVRERQLADGLLGEDGERVVLLEHAQVPRRRKAETVAHADGAYRRQDRLRRAEREQLPKQHRVRVIQREVALAGGAGAGEAGVGSFDLQEIGLFAAHHGNGGVAELVDGTWVLEHVRHPFYSVSLVFVN